MRLANRVALVTGGLNGLGRAIAERFAAEGAMVTVGDIVEPQSARVAQLCRDGAGQVDYLPLDIGDEGAWERAAGHFESRHGKLDIVVHNAGVALIGPLERLDGPAWRGAMQTNVDGVFLGTRRLAPLLARSGAATPAGSSIVFVSSTMAQIGSPTSIAYCTHKAALRQMSRALAVAFARDGVPIRVNALMPGYAETAMLSGFIAQHAEESGVAASELMAGLTARVPMGRIGRPDEIAAAALFLASDDSSYMTGADLIVDGGWTAE